ncbi:2387_t:CDS:2 [Ambispora gerdemannii]|uniref:2387_t:CDS:1 n=1 Tax=Ambispora gerdemannii TaxID=144530 RepID=A0A9N9CFA0_9GLOM|nr:2387_t:CDS:2 [Ambispora gerdemannii]
MSEINNKKLLIKEIEKKDVLLTSLSIPSINSNNPNFSNSNKVELFGNNSLMKNKKKQSTECEENSQQLLATEATDANLTLTYP